MATDWPVPIRTISDERALDILLAEAPGDNGWRRITKKGLRIEGADFDHPNLGGHEGERVKVLFDESNLGEVFVFDDDGDFIAKAVCPERTGISRQELAVAWRTKQRQIIARRRKELRATAKRANTGTIVEDILAERAEAAGKLIRFPGPTVDHQTPALEAASEAAKPRPHANPGLTPEEQEEADHMWAELTGGSRDSVDVDGAPVTPPVTLDAPATHPNGRPEHFADERAFAEWVLANPEVATDDDRAYLDSLMEERWFRQWLGVEPEVQPEVEQ